MRYIYLLTILLLFSCNNERTLLLPEIENATVTEVLDVSPAYIFYDETEPDSTLLNRKNLISTTNWLVNVDKRLTLKQAIPKIIMMQEKKRNAKMHKNEDAKNYFTCNDTSIQNLGFLEFTDVYYFIEDYPVLNDANFCYVTIESLKDVHISTSVDINFEFSKENFKSSLNEIYKEYDNTVKFVLIFNESMTFQDYITVKKELASFGQLISNKEYIN
ncbi:hypothetical protein [Winogradskyella sp. SM1960]|uniref:hypothetical protein n=1 Tax=Winogradskyella sp. SM1960 TaxID=2865955 RepID=UPI001CD25D68|nr:hypothetical protein [Winogradskyella sp. SM1960]